MKWIVFEVQTQNDGTIGTLVYTFDDEKEALSKYYAVLSAAVVSGLPAHSAHLMSNEGETRLEQAFVIKLEPEPEPAEV